MKQFLAILVLAAGGGAMLYRLAAPVERAGAQSARPADDGIRQFRLVVGLTETEEKEWAGRIRVANGELLSVRGWHTSGADRADAEGFQFRNKIGPYENQLGETGFPYGQTDWNDPKIRRLIPQGLQVRVRGTDATRVTFAAEAGTFDFALGQVNYGQPVTRLEGNARVDRVPVERRLSEDGMQDDHPVLAVAPDGTVWTAWIAYQDEGDYVVVSDGDGTTRVTEKGDHHGPALVVRPNGWLVAAWAQREGEAFHIYTSVRAAGRWTPLRRMSADGSSNFAPQLAVDGENRIALVWQSLREGRSSIRMRFFDGRNWGDEQEVNQDAGNAWAPSVTVHNGVPLIAWDSYTTGAYQIYFRNGIEGPVERVTLGASFSVRPSIAVAPDGRPVIAWEESDPLWGKDYAFLLDRRGTSLYKNRRIRVALRDGGAWKEIAANVADAIPAEVRRFIQQPRIAFDAAGRLHMVFRCRTYAATARVDHWASQGRWETFLTRLDNDRWMRAVVMPYSEGRNGMRAALAIHKDMIHVAWPTDQRAFPQNKYGDLEVFTTALTSSGAPSNLTNAVAMREQPFDAAANPHPNENDDIRRIRAHRVTINGKTYRIVRGDLHRHTELSQDGAGDGSLDDLYRYALDAAQMDFAHVADHQMGVDEPYNWWITQKSNDLYLMPQRFVPLYGYERSVPYPNGHRNLMWAERGIPVLKISPEENKGAVNTGSVLYPYLRHSKGIATSHTSATPQGTDWRDNDAALEPIVEIYQGFESSYEHAGAPRAWKAGEKAVHQGLRPAGYVWNAWAKGYKLGVQSSSDHVSTHTSFACLLVENFTREGLMDAMRRRHTYAATDAIVLDYRLAASSGEALMGDIVSSATAPRLSVKVSGTAPIKQIDVVKNNTYVHKLNPNQRDASFTYVDASFGEGESYYYVRVEQADGQLAWSSPIWVKKAGGG